MCACEGGAEGHVPMPVCVRENVEKYITHVKHASFNHSCQTCFKLCPAPAHPAPCSTLLCAPQPTLLHAPPCCVRPSPPCSMLHPAVCARAHPAPCSTLLCAQYRNLIWPPPPPPPSLPLPPAASLVIPLNLIAGKAPPISSSCMQPSMACFQARTKRPKQRL